MPAPASTPSVKTPTPLANCTGQRVSMLVRYTPTIPRKLPPTFLKNTDQIALKDFL
jgi:hypothetical protein